MQLTRSAGTHGFGRGQSRTLGGAGNAVHDVGDRMPCARGSTSVLLAGGLDGCQVLQIGWPVHGTVPARWERADRRRPLWQPCGVVWRVAGKLSVPEALGRSAIVFVIRFSQAGATCTAANLLHARPKGAAGDGRQLERALHEGRQKRAQQAARRSISKPSSLLPPRKGPFSGVIVADD